MDLKEGWERKALIGLGIIVVIIFIIAYFDPFIGTPDNSSQQQVTTTAPASPLNFMNPTTNNTTSNNSTINGNFTYTSAQAQQIALNANSGFTISSTTQGNVALNGTTHSVWILAMINGTSSKTVYVDATSGNILTI